MKKTILSLTLVLALCCGLFCGSSIAAEDDASAADVTVFSDSDDIIYRDAVALMTARGIINGNPDGTFDPTRIVTRAEMAKMISVMIAEDGEIFDAPQADFTDLSDTHWARPYINYCAQKGIIVGHGNGLCDPNGPITATAAAKMALVALGYNPELEGFSGAGWADNTNMKAYATGLYIGLDKTDLSQGATRDEAALILSNALITPKVVYKRGVPVPETDASGRPITLSD